MALLATMAASQHSEGSINVCQKIVRERNLTVFKNKLGNRHTRGSARATNARGRSTRGLTSEPVPSAITTAPQM